MRSLTYRERLFVDYYLGESSESAVDAVRRAWYPSPEELGPRLLKKSAVQAAIAAGAGTAAITPNEVLARYADIAASDMRDFMAVDKNGGLKVDLKLSQQRDLGHLIKRVRIHKDGSQDIELEPRLPALAKLGEYFNLGKGEAEPQVTLVELAKNLRRIMRNGNSRRCRNVEEMTKLLRLCHNEPELFNKLFLNRPAYWSRQVDLCRSVVEYRTTVAYSGNMVGKDYWIAGIIVWWLFTRPDCSASSRGHRRWCSAA